MATSRQVAAFALALAACSSPTPYEGLAPAQHAGGPQVRFDLLHKPLPEIPFPNDVATVPDAKSPTGLRVNASQIAPSELERTVRQNLDRLDGFGTYAPITVAFDQDLDVLDFHARQNDADPANDAVYLIDLVTGERRALDVNGGRFPLELPDPGQYFRHDPDSATTNLLLPVRGPNPNFLHPVDPAWAASHGGVAQQSDDLMTFYERATRTLILRPVTPLAQQHLHAVVLTKKLKGLDGKSVESPFSGVHHVLQTKALARLPAMLPPGVTLADVAFAWTFTTQSTTKDLELLREGLWGRGPFAALSSRFPVVDARAGKPGLARMQLLPVRDLKPGQAGMNVYTVPASKLVELIHDPQIGQLVFGTASDTIAALEEGMQYVDYFAMGSFETANLLDDPSVRPGDETFRLDPSTGAVEAKPQTVWFIVSVPKATAEHKPPFPVAMYGHGYGSARFEGPLLGGGILARHGLAMISIDAFGHGLALDPLLTLIATQVAKTHGLEAFGAALFKGRARDLDNDGTAESGGDFWTANAFHTRDVVRQSVVDWFQLVRLIRSWDGKTLMSVEQSAGTEEWVAGDFNHDGVPDLGGELYNMGSSLGGILSSIAPAVEPEVVAAAPSSGGSGLSDIGLRSNLGVLVKAVFLEVMGPMIVTCPWSPSEQRCSGAADAKPSLVFHVAKVNTEGYVPIAQAALQPGDRVTACNLQHLGALPVPPAALDEALLPDGCHRGVADLYGNVRISINADGPKLDVKRTPKPSGVGEYIEVSAASPGDAIVVTIAPAAGGAARTVDKWEWANDFMGLATPAGAPLRSPARGYGKVRNTPDFRRLFQLSQTIMEPGDPVSYAPHYFLDPLPVRAGKPVNIAVIVTMGDKIVPTASGLATGRAAGLVDTETVDPAYGKTIDRVLVESGVVEAGDNLRRYRTDQAGPRKALPGHILCDDWTDRGGVRRPARCDAEIMLDPTGFACDDQGRNCLDDWGAPRLSPPLREQLIRRTANGVSALLIPYMDPNGQHAVQPPRPAQRFDMNFFMLNLAGRYFVSGGRELSFDKCQAKSHDCPWIPPPPAQ